LRLYAELTGNSAIIHLISHLSLFASLGSVGDLMPVLYDTRNVIKQGVAEFNRLLDCESFDDFFGCSIEMLPNEYVNPFIALYYLHFWMLRNNYVAPGDVTDFMYGFTYCPMFNSIKRMGASLDNLYDLLYSNFNEEDCESFYDNAEWLYDLNKQRKAAVAHHFACLFDTDNEQPYAPYVFYTSASPGIMGLLAMKAMGVTGGPVMVVGDNPDSDYVSGSGRLPKWFDATLMSSPEISDYVTVAGHAAAFGISIKKDKLNDFCEWLYDTVKSEIKRCEAEFVETRLALGIDHPDLYPECDYSICTNNDYDVCYECALEVSKYGPYGNGYPEPEFRLFFTKRDVLQYKTMGSDNSHFRAVLPHNITLVYFSGASCYKDFERAEDDHVFCFAGNFVINEFRGDCTLQFKVNAQIY
jgi:single-stranded-DNA-specific exonuclease